MRVPSSVLCPLLASVMSIGCATGGAPPEDPPPGLRLDAGTILVVASCEEVAEHARRGGSDEALCFLPHDGCRVEIDACCSLDFRCVESDGAPPELMRAHECATGCDRSCERLGSAETCRLSPGCEWLDETTCEPAPEGYVTGQRCIRERGVACFDERDCDEGWSCDRYWVSLCDDDEPECSRCAVESRRCTPPQG
jgi:hypothetical protein